MKGYIILLLLLATYTAYGQEQPQRLKGKALIDSLLGELPKAKEDTSKVKLLLKLSSLAPTYMASEEIKYSSQALTLAQQLNWPRGMARGYHATGNCYRNKGDRSRALDAYLRSADIYGQIGDNSGQANLFNVIGSDIYMHTGDMKDALEYFQKALRLNPAGDKANLAKILSNIGNVDESQGDIPDALDHYLKALKMNEETGDKKAISSTLNRIGVLYYHQKDRDKALEYYLRAKVIYESSGNEQDIGPVLENIAAVYADRGDTSHALECLMKAKEIFRKAGNKNKYAVVMANIGAVYAIIGDHQKALDFLLPALEILKQFGDKEKISGHMVNIGFSYARLNRFDEALPYAEGAAKLAQEAESIVALRNSYELLTDVYERKKEWQKAYESYAKLTQYRDSALNVENTRKTLKMEMNYEISKKEDSFRFQRQLSEAELERQKLETRQQAQALQISKQNLSLAEKEKELQHLAFLREQAEKQQKEKQLRLAANEHELQESRLTGLKKEKALQAKDLENSRLQRNLFVGGTALMLLLAGSVLVGWRQTRKEKKVSESLLLNILPEEVANELKEKGAAQARHFDNVSVIFTDFVDFTVAAEKLSPQELVSELHECFSAFDKIVEKNGLEKIKTVGDAYLAVCGLPGADPSHAAKTIKAALEISDFIRKRNKVFEIRVGVNSGSVVAGIVGVKKFAYDIWGDAVNTAARMEQNCERGRVNVSEATYKLAGNGFSFEYRGEISAKNKGMLKMYYVAPPAVTE